METQNSGGANPFGHYGAEPGGSVGPGGPGGAPAPAGPNVGLAVVGAAIGAAVGAALWAVVEYVTHYQVGYVAVGVGALAGIGAAKLGGGKGVQIGIIAALLGGGGVLAGSYASYYLYLHGGRFETDLREAAEDATGHHPLTADEESRFDDALAAARASITYKDYLTADEKNMAFMALFGILGISYGFKVGRGP